MANDRQYQKKSVGVTSKPQTPTRTISSANQENELQGAIGNREMGRLIETHRQNHPSSLNPNNPGEMPLLGGMMPVSQGRIQRQPLFRGLSEEMWLENATLALPESGAAVQRKLTLGTVGDVYEQEADRVARHVVDEIQSSPFRASDTTSEGERIAEDGEMGRVQRQITVRAAGDAGGELSGEWERQLQRAKGGGQPLSPTVREKMGEAFGADFGGVRVHTGKQADMLARSIQARAFTTGQDVFFRQGAYEPGSRGGQELLAHELTHVTQQNNGLKGNQEQERRNEKEKERIKKKGNGKGQIGELRRARQTEGKEKGIERKGIETETSDQVCRGRENTVQRAVPKDGKEPVKPEPYTGSYKARGGGNELFTRKNQDRGRYKFGSKTREEVFKLAGDIGVGRRIGGYVMTTDGTWENKFGVQLDHIYPWRRIVDAMLYRNEVRAPAWGGWYYTVWDAKMYYNDLANLVPKSAGLNAAKGAMVNEIVGGRSVVKEIRNKMGDVELVFKNWQSAIHASVDTKGKEEIERGEKEMEIVRDDVINSENRLWNW